MVKHTLKILRCSHINVISAELFHDGRPYYIETSPLICSADQWTGFYMIGKPVINKLNDDFCFIHSLKFMESLIRNFSREIYMFNVINVN